MSTLLSLNINGGLGAQLRPLTALLAELDADVLCLQECSRAVGPWLQSRLAGDWQEVYAPATYNGNAILSRFPITRRSRISLETPGHTEQRSAADAVIALPEGALRVCCVHLDHVLEDLRLAQWAALSAETDAVAGGLLCGDLNALCRSDYSASQWAVIAEGRRTSRWEVPESRLMETIFAAGFRDAAAGCEIAPTSRFNTRIDYILAADDCPWRFARYTTVEALALGVTDHNGVMVRLTR